MIQRNTRAENIKTALIIIGLLACIFVCMLITSCSKRVVEVVESPQVSYVRDTVRIVDKDIQQIYVRDSIVINGDTVMRDRLVYRDRLKSDTIYKVAERTDTVTVVKTVQLEAKAKSSWWWLLTLVGGIVVGWLIHKKLA